MKNFVIIIIFILSIIITRKVNHILSSHIVLETSQHAFRRIFTIWWISLLCLGALANKVGLIDINNDKSSNNQSSVQVQENRVNSDRYAEDQYVEDKYAGANEYSEDNGSDVDEEIDFDEDIDDKEKEYEEEEYEEGEYNEGESEEEENEDWREFVFPESDTRVLKAEEIKQYDSDILRIARNEIYARHGRRFNDSILQGYFDSLSWYKGTIAPEDFDEGVLNSIEKKNLKKIEKYE